MQHTNAPTWIALGLLVLVSLISFNVFPTSSTGKIDRRSSKSLVGSGGDAETTVSTPTMPPRDDVPTIGVGKEDNSERAQVAADLSSPRSSEVSNTNTQINSLAASLAAGSGGAAVANDSAGARILAGDYGGNTTVIGAATWQDEDGQTQDALLDSPTHVDSMGYSARHTKRGEYPSGLCLLDGTKTLYYGHSHVVWLNQLHCELLGYTRERRSGCPGVIPIMDPFMDQYLATTTVKARMLSRITRGQRMNRIVLSSWAWDMLFTNYHPDVVSSRMLTALMNSVMHLENSTRIDNQIIIMMPHYHLVPTWKSRAPCQKEHRILAYRAAIEAAVLKFNIFLARQGLLRNMPRGVGGNPNWGKWRRPENEKITVHLLDLYQWSRRLPPGRENWNLDGAHFTMNRKREIIRSLFKYGILCSGRAPRMPEPPATIAQSRSLLRLPRGDALAPQVYRRAIAWPSIPSCEVLRQTSTSWFFWPNIKQRVDHLNIGGVWMANYRSSLRFQLARFYIRYQFPRDAALRHQIVSILQRSRTVSAPPAEDGATDGGFGTAEEPVPKVYIPNPFEALDCANNFGFGDNLTTWDSGYRSVGQPNMEWIFWRLGESATSRQNQESTIANKSVYPPPPRIPICTCRNTTHLLPPLHERLQTEKGVTPAEIAAWCRVALADFVPPSWNHKQNLPENNMRE